MLQPSILSKSFYNLGKGDTRKAKGLSPWVCDLLGKKNIYI